MDSRKLSQRAVQPGHDQTYRASEGNFSDALRRVLNTELFEIEDKPAHLRRMLPNPGVEGASAAYGVVPEVCVTRRGTDRRLYFEVKKQGKGGNADERACKHHTVRFQQQLKAYTGYDYHCFITIMCESLATHPKYVAKHGYFFEEDHFYCWCDYDDLDELAAFLERVIRKYLVPEDPGVRVLAGA